MKRTEKVNRLYHILDNAKTPLTRIELSSKLDNCSRATFYRLLDQLFLESGREVLKDSTVRPHRYSLEPADDRTRSIPNLLLRDKEIETLIIIEQMTQSLNQGYLKDTVENFRKAIEDKLTDQNISLIDWKKRFKFLPMASKKFSDDIFQLSATAVLRKKQLLISYKSLKVDSIELVRSVSPQTLFSYRDNWYMDAFCHLASDMRTFLLSRITSVEISREISKHIPISVLEKKYNSSYGIFSGSSVQSAEIRFTNLAAQVVKDELWHQAQEVVTLSENEIVLTVPYANPTELIMDILKWGADAEVISPSSLRQVVKEKIENMRKMYECLKN